MKTLFFVRHGQTEWNVIKRFQGRKDSSLTKQGIEQTKALKANIEDVRIDKIFSSPLGRALDTAKILKNKNTELIADDLLKEMSFGNIEGLMKEEIKNKYPNELKLLWSNALEYDPTPYNGETYLELEERVKEFLLKIQNDDSKNMMIVAHGVILKVIFKVIQNQEWKDIWNTPFPHNTSITVVEVKDNKYKMIDFSNIDHLEGFTLETFV